MLNSKRRSLSLNHDLSPEDTDLAPLDDSFSVRLRWRERSHEIWQRRTEKVIVTWKEIFGRIAPDLQVYPGDTSVNFELGASLYP